MKTTCNKYSITLLLPVLNEVDGVRLILPLIKRELFDQILIVDGGSNDGTLEVLAELGFDEIIFQTKPGLQNAVAEAIGFCKGDFIIEFSLDGNCLPEDLERVIETIREGNDVIVVSRYKDGARSFDDTIVTWFGNKVFSMLFNMLGSNSVTDALTIFRAFNKHRIDWKKFQNYNIGPVFEPLITGIAQIDNLSLIEIPGDEPSRIGGESKMRIIYNGSHILLVWLRLSLHKLLRTFR